MISDQKTESELEKTGIATFQLIVVGILVFSLVVPSIVRRVSAHYDEVMTLRGEVSIRNELPESVRLWVTKGTPVNDSILAGETWVRVLDLASHDDGSSRSMVVLTRADGAEVVFESNLLHRAGRNVKVAEASVSLHSDAGLQETLEWHE